ncbi:MAG: bifunctional oligoribonuclease/PAP phosphatase NrnA [Bacteroidetes bacterium]|nr:bifunctional oligoribonuclease/PAP phosphatase NrnA [Bacteroidota bacterium]
MIDFSELKKIIEDNNSFLLTTHVNPDADAIGSEIAFYFILKELGKKVFVINHSETPYNLEFLDTDNVIEKYDEQKHSKIFDEVDVLVALDFNRSDRVVRMQKRFNESKKLKICIDHHQDEENFVNHFFIDTNYSATGQIIYDLITKTEIVKLNYQTSYPIYAAIMTDTGSFRFERTSPEIHYIAANLIQQGVNPGEVFDKIYDQSKFSKIRLLGAALDSMQLFGEDKKISYMIIRQETFKKLDAVESDTENFVNYNLSVEGVVIGLLFIELKEGFKVSFRSKGTIPMNKLAAEFGGGGHINAAGARIRDGKLDEYMQKILSKTEEYLTIKK